ncbi:MAG: peptide chain release factor N(5)-glutamine methyltransferase [Candidatus Aminicenantes bacterium]|nr:MAG: peptide chain release factor N(5)-glutamine methyltransferase [Candidatus Aminicenantes bacterium]
MSTIRELYTEALSLLKNFPDASVESKVLVLKSLAISEEVFYSYPDRHVSKSEKQRFYESVLKRQQGIPLSYVVGEKEFWSLPFKVSPGVLIPRPETEHLVEKVLELSTRTEEVIIDIGTGSGNIAVSLARELPKARILATDISPEALKTARMNASVHKVSRITFLKGNLFSALSGLLLEEQCDFIVSNPPYVTECQWETLQDEIRLHEPKKALVSGKTGREIIERLASGAPNFLKQGGYLCMEIGLGQQDDVLNLFGMEWERVDSFKDLSGIPRLVIAQKII